MTKTATLEKPTRVSLEKRIAELHRRDSDLLKEQIAFEATKTEPLASTDPRLRHSADAEAMLTGQPPEAPLTNDGNRHWQVLNERGVIKKAIELGNLRLMRLLAEQKDEIAKDLEIAWGKNIRATAELIGQIESLALERDRLRSEWCVRTGLDVRPPCYIEGARIALPHSQNSVFLTAARRLHLIDRK